MPTSIPSWSELLHQAVNEPGTIMKAYSAFHDYSVGNQVLALWQCKARKLKPGPINTYTGWQRLGRQVRKGERALTLLKPVTVKAKNTKSAEKEEEAKRFTAFTYEALWFVLSQTEGEELPEIIIPDFDSERALEALGITRLEFENMDGNCQGYARGQGIAINPAAALPHKTYFHECAHVILRHTAEGDFVDGEKTPKNLREVEAESVALICCESLNLSGAEYCRGYIQNWFGDATTIPDKSAQKIFRAADLLLRAGRGE